MWPLTSVVNNRKIQNLWSDECQVCGTKLPVEVDVSLEATYALRMENPIQRLLLISGPVGVGKSTIANELSTLLEADEVPHTFIDLDALAYTFPRNAADPFGDGLALENLKSIWANCQRRGSKNLIVPRVVETESYPERVAEMVAIPDPIVCRLTASDQSLLERVRMREKGSNLSWHEKRSLELSAALEDANVNDFCVATDGRSITEIATEIMLEIDWSR
ncbi:MAG: AAA family ATPase [Rhizobiaceae bacterium]|nr:AAA family ATPase [Rhizobiaceae bacterium]